MRVVIFISFLLFFSGLGFCSTYYVPDDYGTIQGAIDVSAHGDTIRVRAGYYTENIDFYGKAITLIGEQGAIHTIIDGAQAGPVVSCHNLEGEDTILEGFTLFNGQSSGGGGMWNTGASPTVTRCTFLGNRTGTLGGGMSNDSGASPRVTQCLFQGNSALGGGGGGICNNFGGSATVIQCTFQGNSAKMGGAIYMGADASTTITQCTFQANSAIEGSGGGIVNFDASPVVTGCLFMDNTADENGGGMFNAYHSSPVVMDCIFEKNRCDQSGGGICNEESSPEFNRCTFRNNSAADLGGGMANLDISLPMVVNSVFQANSADHGAGMSNQTSSSPVVTHCTFVGNSADTGGGGMINLDSSPTITNCILWNDTPDEIDTFVGSPIVNHSCIQGGYTGTGNIAFDPLFVDAVNQDLHLSQASPCIDAGDSSAPSVPATDFEGDKRAFPGNGKGWLIRGGAGQAIVDMGADEYCMFKKKIFMPK